MVASIAHARAFTAAPYDYAEARRLAAELELAEPIAVMLVRRGYRTVEAARDFLEARDDHDPFAFEGMDEVCERVLSLARRGGRVTVHGDYDVDGVCSTTILVSVLRELGAECDWLIPDRLADGYGLTLSGVEEIRTRGSEMVITVDCGIGSAAEVAAAKAAGLDVIVTDHHEPPTELPGCPILHPVVSGYPFSALCAAGVAHKLAIALRETAGAPATTADLDLVALATVADLVPLIGENRRLVRQGLAAMRASPRPGVRALMAVSKVEAETVDEGALGFRLAPRINAAGRLYRADAGVELMLSSDEERAASIAAELDRANSERRATEREVSDAAETARGQLSPDQAGAPALVLAGEGWHPGVVGIAASRLAERHWRPTVLLSLDGDTGRGSARSIPGFDLIAALDACSEHLVRHGGHRAAAGLELRRDSLEPFREAFLAHATAELAGAELVQTESIDALVGVGREGIGMDLAEQLERVGPFGKGNPDPRLVVPSARLCEIRPLGEAGRHSRFELESGAGKASGVAFGMNGDLERLADREAIDLSVRLEVDRWNGAVSPRVVLRELYPLATAEAEAPGAEGTEPTGCGGASCPASAEEWWARFASAFEGFDGAWPVAPAAAHARPREVVDRRRGAAIAALAELVSSGDSVLAVCADAARRRELAGSAADPRRFGAGEPSIACSRCGEAALDAALGAVGERGEREAGLSLADWGALARRSEAARRFQHVVLIDPPPFERTEQLARAGLFGPGGATPLHPGYLHLAWGAPEAQLAELCAAREWQARGAIAEIWRAASAAPERSLSGEALREALAGPGRYPRTPEAGARATRVLVELGLCEWRLDRGTGALRVLSSERTALERSRAFGACIARHEEAKRYLRNRAQS